MIRTQVLKWGFPCNNRFFHWNYKNYQPSRLLQRIRSGCKIYLNWGFAYNLRCLRSLTWLLLSISTDNYKLIKHMPALICACSYAEFNFFMSLRHFEIQHLILETRYFLRCYEIISTSRTSHKLQTVLKQDCIDFSQDHEFYS